MKGIVFNLLEELVGTDHGEDVWDALLEAAEASGVYTSLGTYPDEEFMRLADAASTALGVTQDDVTRWFGQRAVPRFFERYPQFFEPHNSTRTFLLTLNDIIHPEVRKLFPGADVPVFDFDSSSPDVLGLTYQSKRRLCFFGEGLIEGVAKHFGECVTIAQHRCMKRGDPQCEMEIRFAAEDDVSDDFRRRVLHVRQGIEALRLKVTADARVPVGQG